MTSDDGERLDGRIITLTTDFGTRDPFVGSMKGVILTINPEARIIDISHEINPFDLVEAAFLVSCAYAYFPQGTVHCIVVDPGVGGKRRPILVKTEKYLFVAPDNGVLTYILGKEDVKEVIHVREERFFLKEVSQTFHGRDIFAPVCGWLTKGVDPRDMGPAIEDYILLEVPKAEASSDRRRIAGQVIHIDPFGNVLTNITQKLFQSCVLKGGGHCRAIVKGCSVDRLCHAYEEGEQGGAGMIFSSEGYLELFANKSSLALKWGIRKGDPVEVLCE